MDHPANVSQGVPTTKGEDDIPLRNPFTGKMRQCFNQLRVLHQEQACIAAAQLHRAGVARVRTSWMVSWGEDKTSVRVSTFCESIVALGHDGIEFNDQVDELSTPLC